MMQDKEQAIDQFMGEQFIEWLLNYISAEVKSWPELAAIRAAHPKVEKIRKFILQRFLAAEAFLGGREGDPGFLGFAIGNLSESDDPSAESALEILEKKRQEELSGGKAVSSIPYSAHRELWIKLLHSLGITDEEIKRAEPKEATRSYTSELSDVYSNSEWQTAAGAFAAHERCVPEEYSAVSEMLKSNTQVTDHDLEILHWHQGSDHKYAINTAHVLDKIVFDKENKLLVWEGVKRQLDARKNFYAALAKYLEANK